MENPKINGWFGGTPISGNLQFTVIQSFLIFRGSYYTVETLVLYSKFWDKATSQQLTSLHGQLLPSRTTSHSVSASSCSLTTFHRWSPFFGLNTMRAIYTKWLSGGCVSNSFCVELRPFRKCRAILESVHGNSCGEKNNCLYNRGDPKLQFCVPSDNQTCLAGKFTS